MKIKSLLGTLLLATQLYSQEKAKEVVAYELDSSTRRIYTYDLKNEGRMNAVLRYDSDYNVRVFVNFRDEKRLPSKEINGIKLPLKYDMTKFMSFISYGINTSYSAIVSIDEIINYIKNTKTEEDDKILDSLKTIRTKHEKELLSLIDDFKEFKKENLEKKVKNN